MTDSALPQDPFIDTCPAPVQEALARKVQAVFMDTLQRSLAGEAASAERLAHVAAGLSLGRGESVAETRMRALAIHGLDQWGLAYAQAFGADCMDFLTALVASLRADAGPAALDHLQALANEESTGFAFKQAVRDGIHLGLWHALIGETDAASGRHLAQALGSQMLALLKAMPTHGWRVLARSFAEIQMRCVGHGLAQSGLAKELNEALFAALNAHIDKDTRDRIIAAADQAVQAWQRDPSGR